MIEKIKKLAEQSFEEILEIRRHIHQYPELSFQEHKTSKYIKSILEEWEIPYKDNIAKTGIVVLLEGRNPSSKINALRADFDALPIKEENEVAYCSVNQGVMHACGHDAHTASMLGSLKILNNLKSQWEGSIKFVFQPAEEQLPGGAQQMIKEGVLENPKVEKMIGQHVFPEMEVGKVGFRSGKYMASADEIFISVNGKGGHAALPHAYNNPIIASAKLITSLHDHFIKDLAKPAIFGIGFIKADGSTNVIPDNLQIKGTFRAMDEVYRSNAHKIINNISRKISREFDVEIDLKIKKGLPSLKNDVDVTNRSISLAKEYLGAENVIDLPIRMTAEDFAYFSQEVPSCFYRLGTRNELKGITYGLHTSRFNIDEDALKIGMGLMSYLAIRN